MKLISLQPVYQPNMRDFKEPAALFKKSRGISPVLAACPISDALITWIPADTVMSHSVGILYMPLF